MKKSKIAIVLLAIILVSSFLIKFPLYSRQQSERYKYLTDNTIVVTNGTGFTNEQKQQIMEIEGVVENLYLTDYTNQYRLIGNEQNQKVRIGMKGLPVAVQDYIDISLISGTKMDGPNQILLSQSLVDILVNNQFISGDIIGDKLNMDQVYTIKGVYADPQNLTISTSEEEEINEENQIVKPVSTIDVTGTAAITSNYQPLAIDEGLEYYNFEVINNEENRANDQLQHVVWQGDNNYQEWQDLGAEGLIMPSLNYGSTFDTFGLIKVDGDVELIAEQIQSIIPDSAIVTNKSSAFDINNNWQHYLVQVGLGLVLLLVLIVPILNKRG